ncbi:hypothetical protein Tsubulata_000632 [Turnera subulata]|uniref:CASP-like protein n=1 Tax=Turnera subulata TaxID=218843 RepID=A0A9Q0GHI9_9ROSI|nr:hypothetical protein Tsubulata_000632 [Turnera subulata]
MENIEAKNEENTSTPMKTQKILLGVQIFLRVLTVATTLTAAALMVTNKQTVSIGGFVLDAKYSYDPTFKFFALANFIVCACTTLSLLFLYLAGRKGCNPNHYFMLFIHDLLAMSLVLAGFAAGTAIGYVGKYGNFHTGWMSICDQFGKFCKRGTASMTISFLGLLSLLILTIISANKSRQIQV